MPSPAPSTFWPWRDPEIDGLDLDAPPRGVGLADQGRTGAIVCVVGEDSSGVLLATFGPRRVAIGHHIGYDQRGLVTMPAIVNLAPVAFTGAWSVVAGTVTNAAAVGPDGYKTAASIAGTNAQGYRLGGLALGSAGTRYAQWFAMATVAHTARVVLEDTDTNVVDTEDFAVTTTWQPFNVSFTWNGATSGVGRLRFCGSNSGTTGTILLCPVICVSSVKSWTGHIPIGSPGATIPTCDVSTLTERVNREGELAVTFVSDNVITSQIARLHNGANDNDARGLQLTAATDVIGDHADGTGSNTAATISGTGVDVSLEWTAKLRWQRAALVDGTASEFTAVRAEQGATVDVATGRSATWTASTVPVSALDIGHGAGAEVLAGLVFAASVKAREPKI